MWTCICRKIELNVYLFIYLNHIKCKWIWCWEEVEEKQLFWKWKRWLFFWVIVNFWVKLVFWPQKSDWKVPFVWTCLQLDSAWTRTLMSTIPALSQRKIWFLLLNCIENVKKNREWLDLDLILFIHLFKAVALEPVLLLDNPNRGPEQELAHSWQEAVNV